MTTTRALIWCAVSSKAQAADDKASLPQQEADARALCERHGWQVVDVLTVPGHSRSYIDFYEMADAAQQQGIDAFYRLRDHWKARDFDVLIVRDGDRFAREQAPVALIIGSVIQSGARIYSLQDGWIDAQNHRIHSALVGYRAASEVDQIRQKQRIGKDQRAMQGLFTSGRHVYSHLPVRDDFGKITHIVVDESKRRLFDDVATIVLEGVGWRRLEEELYRRYGHVDPRTGQPFKRMFMYHLLYNPWFWGHAARRFKSADVPHGQGVGAWCIGQTAPVPEHVLMRYDTHEPVYTGEQASAVRAELLRRLRFHGGGRPDRAHRFTGLLLCYHCGFYMVYSGEFKAPRWRCHSKHTARSRAGCDRLRYVPESVVLAWFDDRLRQMLATEDPFLLARDEDDSGVDRRASQLHAEIAAVRGQVETLIVKQAAAPAAVSDLYDGQIAALGEQLDILKRNLAEVENSSARYDARDVEAAYDELRRFDDLARFWRRDGKTVNQLLHRLMGHRRAVVKDEDVEGTADAPPHPRLSHGGRRKRR